MTYLTARDVAAQLIVLASCAPAAPSVTAPPGELPTTCREPVEAFDQAALEYAEAHDLPLAWVAFEAAQRDRLCLAHEVAAWHRARGGVFLSVRACEGADVPEAEGVERAAAIERFLELSYAGLGFSLAWHGPGLPLRLDCPDAHGRLDGVRLCRDGGAAHEVGHMLGLPHHYSSDDQQGLGLHMWSPDEETCTEDLTGGLDTACAGALDVELPDRDALDAAAWALYCAACARGEPWEGCGGVLGTPHARCRP